MGPRGLPRTWRHMNGYGSHTFMWINEDGERVWVKYHFHTEQGMEFFSNAEAMDMAGRDADFHRRDLFDAIARGDHPDRESVVHDQGGERRGLRPDRRGAARDNRTPAQT